ncbi:haloacid dehalogenase type II [Gryllotalpicola reticulitermitis]|uniref:Haloacid dehalogenase type II n=1 Tax=Gryllotalpicola reticulitermitis TaxID=1184153 RepID=A0ABV8Q246_9MICO
MPDSATTPEIVIFDVLGTVLDERAGFRHQVARLGTVSDPIAFADQWFDAVSAGVAEIAAGRKPWRPWEQVIVGVLRDLAPGLSESVTAQLGQVGRRLPAWPDSRQGLQQIRSRRRVIALSNAGVEALISSFRAEDLQWDAVLSSEMVHSAKPNPRVYEFLLDHVRADPSAIVMAAAHPWDLRAAAQHGLRTAYIARAGEGDASPDDTFDWQVESLTGLAEALDE